MKAFDTLFTPAQKERLGAAIPRRYACRSYAGAPSVGDWAALSYAAERYALPGARLALEHVSESLFTGTLLNLGRVTGCTAVAAVIASSREPLGRIHAGILGEALCLEAVAMGLGCCWISGTYRKKQLQLPLDADEAVLAIIALGIPKQQAQPPRKRKPLEHLCEGDNTLWPEDLRRAAEAVRLAPSALNMQPWTMRLGNYRFSFDAPERAQLDLGIGLCHAELTLRGPHRWHFRQGRRDPAAWIEEK